MTEHAAVIFVFFFLAEYASIVLICILTSILFLGGYNFTPLFPLINNLVFFIDIEFFMEFNIEDYLNDPLLEGLLYGIILGLKSCIMIFIFI
jgi:NADH-ubiquinone oxidoreductase chain 1